MHGEVPISYPERRINYLLREPEPNEKPIPWVNALPVKIRGSDSTTLLTVIDANTRIMSSSYILRDPKTGNLYHAKSSFINVIAFQRPERIKVHRQSAVRESELQEEA